jgi:hypothetical protein
MAVPFLLVSGSWQNQPYYQAVVKAEARFDGKNVLRINTELPAPGVAGQYKLMLRVKQLWRAAKSLVHTRPISHQWDASIKGQVLGSVLALGLLDELPRRAWAYTRQCAPWKMGCRKRIRSK